MYLYRDRKMGSCVIEGCRRIKEEIISCGLRDGEVKLAHCFKFGECIDRAALVVDAVLTTIVLLIDVSGFVIYWYLSYIIV